MNTTPTELPKYTNEELEMALSTKNYKTLKSTFLIKWSLLKIEVRMFKATLIGIWHQLFGRKDK